MKSVDETKWLGSPHPTRVLAPLQGKGSERKRWLFVHACCRRVEHELTDPRSVAALAGLERHIEGQLAQAGLRELHRLADEGMRGVAAVFCVEG